MLRVPDKSAFFYKCKNCGFTNVKRKTVPYHPDPLGISRGATLLGNYSEATPTPASYDEEIYSAVSISFTASSGDTPAKIWDSNYLLADKGFCAGNTIVIATESGTNDGAYTLSGASGITSASLSLISGDDLTTEDASTAGTVTISIRWYKPSITTGCPFCGTLNSR